MGAAYRVLFALSVIPASLAVFTLLFIKDKDERRDVKKKWTLDLKMMDREYKVNLLVAVIFFLGVYNYAFLVLRAKDLLMPLALIPLSYAFYNLVYGAAAIPAGQLSDKVGRRRVITLGYIVFAVSALGMGMAPNYYVLMAFFFTFGVYMAIIETSQRAYIAGLADPAQRGTAMGVYHGAIGFAALPAGLIAGVLWDVTLAGVRATFLFSTVTSIVAVALFTMLCADARCRT